MRIVASLWLGIVDVLADELVGVRLPEFEAAETRRRQIVRNRDTQRAILRPDRGMDGMGVEAVVDRDVAGECVVDPLLRLDRDHGAPAGHAFCPFHGVYADVGAAIRRDDAVAEVLASQCEQPHGGGAFLWLVTGILQQEVADAEAGSGVDQAVVEPVHDQRAVVGRCQDEGDLARRIRHGHFAGCAIGTIARIAQVNSGDARPRAGRPARPTPRSTHRHGANIRARDAAVPRRQIALDHDRIISSYPRRNQRFQPGQHARGESAPGLASIAGGRNQIVGSLQRPHQRRGEACRVRLA